MNSFIIIVASSGGHLSQALAASSLIERRIIITNKKGVAALDSNNVEVISFDTTKNLILHFLNFLIAVKTFFKYRVTGVFSTGGPMSLPFILLAKLLRKKVLYMDTMSRIQDLSNTGKFVYKLRLFDDFFVQWPDVKKKYAGVKLYGQIFSIYDDRNT